MYLGFFLSILYETPHLYIRIYEICDHAMMYHANKDVVWQYGSSVLLLVYLFSPFLDSELELSNEATVLQSGEARWR